MSSNSSLNVIIIQFKLLVFLYSEKVNYKNTLKTLLPESRAAFKVAEAVELHRGQLWGQGKIFWTSVGLT